MRGFKLHNQRVFHSRESKKNPCSVVLCEMNSMHSAHIAYSYITNVLAKKYAAKIVAYSPRSPQSWKQKILFKIKQVVGFEQFGVYRSFGVKSFWDASVTYGQKQKAKSLSKEIARSLQSLEDLDALSVKGVKIGDLIYDTYLRRYNSPTVDLKSERFQRHLYESLALFVAWNAYFDKHDVCAINVSHCVYNLALPLRIAIQRGIAAYQANITHVYQLNDRNLFAYNDFHYFSERFSALPEDLKETGLAEAQRRIERRLGGEVGVDMSYSKKSAYGAIKGPRLIRKSPRKKILIATHCFFDSPHSYGTNLFPDFYTWLEFLGKMTKCTNYDWYVKTHPDYLPGTMDIILQFVARYPKFTLLPSDSSHHQIVAEGIDIALTVYGTIGFEYAAMGIPVINASVNNPHIAYDFNIHPRSINEYRDILLSLDTLSFDIKLQKIYEYYFMRFIYNTENIFFENYSDIVKELGGYKEQFTPRVYDLWCREFSQDKHEHLCSGLKNFIDSDDFRMDYSHLGQEFSIKYIGR